MFLASIIDWSFDCGVRPICALFFVEEVELVLV
jgi:hypothetical protein